MCGNGRPSTAQTDAYRLVDMMAESFYVILAAREGEPASVPLPMTTRAQSIPRERNNRSRLHAFDASKKALGPVLRHQGEKFGDAFFVRRARNFRKRMQALGHGGKRKKSIASMIV